MNNDLKITAQAAGVFSFAMQQNYIPLIRGIRLVNEGESSLEGVTVRAAADPEFMKPFEQTVPLAEGMRTTEISPVKLTLSPEYLFSLTEKVNGNIRITAAKDGETLAEADIPVEILAYDQWSGYGIMPELVSAFCAPNHPLVNEVVSEAALKMQEWTGSPAFTGYQSEDPNVVKQQAAAIYAALQARGIAYTVPPASFEKSGQRVRLPYTVLTEKHGTCLDLALLYASCLEQIGLNPLIIIVKGHAFAGFWLEDETFADCAEDDCSALKKRAAEGIDKICAVECTDFAAGESTDFGRAESHALSRLDEQDKFICAVDVRRCRGSGIRPIPARVAENGEYRAVDYGKQEITDAPRVIDTSRRGGFAEGRELTKQMIWERKLLDLSLRNSLLNFRPSASNVQFMTADIAKLEDVMSGGESFRIMPAPSEKSFTMSDSRIYEIENEKDLITSIAESEFRNRRLRTFVSEAELEKTLKKLHRDAKVSLEENGANTLYLALGFLRWYETDKSAKPKYAPLILVPVDIVKKIQDKSYSLRIRGEDTQMNITLLELLRQDHGLNVNGLDPLPTDENGVDIPLVLSTMRQAVMSKKRWDVEEIAFLGQFSFSRFIMWNDIRNRSDELAKNKVVASLMSGKTEWETEELDLSPHALDERVLPADMAVPLSADSSQLAAVYEASLGRSFVLHGPPGTGKSQTITNMIANALFHGKSVLFVAEKMAALSVVQKRLAKIGLDPFCLELHSNKATKRSVLTQLESALSMSRIKSPAEYSQTAEKLHSLRKELNDTMSALYKERAAGMSVSDAIANFEAARAFDGRISIDPELIGKTDSFGYSTWLEAASDAEAAGRELGGLQNSPLKNVCLSEYTIELRSAFAELSELLVNKANDAAQAYTALSAVLGAALPSDKTGIDGLFRLLKEVIAPEMLIEPIINGENPQLVRSEMDKLTDVGMRCASIRADIGERFEQSVWSYDPDAALLQLKKAQQSNFISKTFGVNKQVKEFALYAKSPDTVNKENITAYLGTLSEYRQLSAMINAADPMVTRYFGEHWRGENTAFARLKSAIPASFELRTLLGSVSPELKAAVIAKKSEPSLQTALSEAELRYFDLLGVCDRMKSEFAADIVSVCGGADFFGETAREAQGYCGSAEILRDRVVLENSIRRLNGLGLKPAADAYRDGTLDESSIKGAVSAAVCKSVISRAVQSESLLKAFQGAEYERTVEKYRNFTARFEELTIEELVSRLSARVPDTSTGKTGASSELAILQKAIKSGGRGLSIRKLFDSIPNLLGRLCPCMLMSPISAAQYIDPSFGKFDLVIFDEASQLPTSEAVGAIARGENVVVVGDPKQLPPTSFFTANQTDEENIEKEDLESVLDDCLALAMPQKHLLWHYRSRHESLIAYSNSRFYDNSLRTFPSPDDLVSKVNWVHVDGYYDKGGSKQNRAEAEAVTAEIVRRLSDPELRKDSIGVVTFNIIQQILIDDMLSEELRRNPELEQYANEMYEPILVKNLENVQGDERDVILFSIGYAPDKNGELSMNFGPVNQDGGWRRLNVAISRARKEMTVFSVIRPEQIDLGRTRSEGVAGLKGFLDFAAKGSSALPVRKLVSAEKRGSAFADRVAHEIETLGYSVRRDIGSSDYKIDIGVIDPDETGTYLLGIMCESRSGYELTNARDRNIVQPSVLRGLGWRIVNVHALDWLDNDRKVLEYLRGEIEATLAAKRSGEPAPAPAEPQKREVTFEKEEPAESESSHIYVPFVPEVIGDREYFLDNSSTSQIKRIIEAAVQWEAPISRDVLYHYVLAAFGMKSFAKAETRFDKILSEFDYKKTIRDNTVFLWNKDIDPANYNDFRGTSENGIRRKFDDIATEEISAAVRYILAASVSLTRTDLMKETAKLFGFAKYTENASGAISQGIANAVRNGYAKVDQETGRIMYAG
ncbi:MAG: DUF4011 domain-containing protein [Ruminiclostridium sp.]|nr:DUF4011 domain-containing protein [Ruminiclostridium sp.]